ncbi:MAG: transposase [Anaerolineales bacterium]|nr:transposase [Anaerolineales bacterium]
MDKQIIKKKHRKYDAGFKQEALKLVQAGRSVADVSRSLGIGENLLYKWRNDAKIGTLATGAQESNETDLLRKQVRQLEQERDILKKP